MDSLLFRTGAQLRLRTNDLEFEAIVRAVGIRDIIVEPLSRSIYQRYRSALAQGSTITVMMNGDDALYTAPSEILGGSNSRIYLKRNPGTIERHQRRRDFRIPARLKTAYRPLLTETDGTTIDERTPASRPEATQNHGGQTRNISAGGTLIELAHQDEVGTNVEVEVLLPGIAQKNEPVTLTMRAVVRRSHDDGALFVVGLEFIGVAEAEQVRLNRYIHQAQARASSR